MSHVEVITPLQNKPFMESWYELSDESHFWFRWRIRAFLAQLRDLNIPTEKYWNVLDVGCGTGVVRNQVEAETNWSIDATDLDFNALELSRPGRGRTYYYDINERHESMKEQYDAILLFDVIEHVEHTHAFVESLLFHLKTDGYIFINVPAGNYLFSRYDEVQGHFRRYTKPSLLREFEGFPTDVLDVRYWGMSNIPLAALRKVWLQAFAKGRSDEEIFKSGFKPPNSLVNKILAGVMQIESTVIPRPSIGTSLLAVVRKALRFPESK
jgi:SAM-dependent methyltransferase